MVVDNFMVLDKADEKIYRTSELELFSSYSKTCSHEQKTISFWKMAGVCYRRSPTAYRVYFGQYQASSVVLGWLHKGDCSLVQERQSGSWPYHHYRKDVWCLLEKFVTKNSDSGNLHQMLGLHGSKFEFFVRHLFWTVYLTVRFILVPVLVCTQSFRAFHSYLHNLQIHCNAMMLRSSNSIAGEFGVVYRARLTRSTLRRTDCKIVAVKAIKGKDMIQPWCKLHIL